MKFLFDFVLSLILFAIFLMPMVVIAITIKATSRGPVLHWSKRVGKDKVIFKMPKFRTMKTHTPQLATHLLEDPESFYTYIGSFLRKWSLDELPQLISIMKGQMSFVGPRPALFNQEDLIKLRTKEGLINLKPGLTGWAQVNGRDDLSIQVKVNFEKEYLKRKSFFFDLYILWLTLLKTFRRDGISH